MCIVSDDVRRWSRGSKAWIDFLNDIVQFVNRGIFTM